jgi:glycosyltransferase involved in cell wall biosynthesis
LSHHSHPEAIFRIIGGVVPGDEGAASDLKERLRLIDPSGSFIEWSGELLDARTAMRDAWVVVVPSIRPDPFPNVVLEAMSEGRMVIGTSTGGIPEMVTDGTSGMLCNPGDVGALADAMSTALTDRGRAEGCGRAGYEIAVADFSRHRFVEMWRAVFKATFLSPAQNENGRSTG